MRTSLHLDTDLKRRLVQRARAAGFKVQRGPASELPVFLAHMLDQHYHQPRDFVAATPNGIWTEFMTVIRPSMDALQTALQSHDMDLRIEFDSTSGRLTLSQSPQSDKPTRVGLSEHRR
jgi:hypothetical protein